MKKREKNNRNIILNLLKILLIILVFACIIEIIIRINNNKIGNINLSQSEHNKSRFK